MKLISENNIQNQAYQTLMEVYIEEPTDEQYNLLSQLFEEWCKSGRSNLLHHMFEIIESHESTKVRDLVLEHMKKHYPDEGKADIVELWITHPLPRMREFISDIIKSTKFKKPIKSAAYVMLDDYQSLNEIDPDFHYLDSYLRTVDPMLGSLLIQKVEILKNPELNSQLLSTSDDDDEDLSLMDRIRKRDFAYIWENLLDYPVPFIVQILHIFIEEEWEPVDESDKEFFEILIEQFGTKGWYAVDEAKWVVVSKKEGGKFKPLTRVDIDRRSFELHLSQDLVMRPDRITKQKFISRGRFNLSNPELGLNIYMNGVRKSDFDGLLHIPIYSSNGVELAEFTIPAASEKSFAMDEDGLYFTVKNREGIFSLDLDALAAFLLPIARHSERVNEMIPVLSERANEDQKMTIKGLNLLSTLHRGREFSLWDKKQIEDWDDGKIALLDDSKCLCTIAIDVGNTTTKITQVVKGACEHEPKNWEIPTIIYYKSRYEYTIGQDVLDSKNQATSQTFSNIKSALKYGSRKLLRIQNTIVSSYDAYHDFLFRVLDQIEDKIDFDLESIAMTFPSHAPSGFEGWLRSLLQSRGYERIELTDELTASLIGTFRLHNQRGNVMIIDIGSSQIGAAVASMDVNKSRKRLEDSRMREDFDEKPELIAKLSMDKGSLEISELLYQQIAPSEPFSEVQSLLDSAKLELSKDFNTELEISGEKYKISMDNDSDINFDMVFRESELFSSFKLLLRNLLAKGHHRGLSKKKLEDILIIGNGSMWPPFLEYINRIFEGKNIIIEDDNYLTSKGVGLVANGQQLDMNLDEDILLKVAKSGIVGYETMVARGESVLGKSKEFDVRPHSWMDKLVLDCWVRRPIFIPDEEVEPLKDNQKMDHSKDTRNLFTYDRVFREIIDLEGDATLKVNCSTRGTLYFEVQTGDKVEKIETDTSLY